MTASVGLTKMSKYRKQDLGTHTFKPLYNFAQIQGGTIGYKHVYMILSYLTANNVKLMFYSYLSQYITGPYGHLAG